MNKLKEEFIKECATSGDAQLSDLNGVRYCMLPVDEVWNWITKNYISKEEILGLECLKEEDIYHKYAGAMIIRNQLRNELKQQIIDYKNK